MGLDSLCRWQVSVYCTRRISAHLGYTQCSILLHLIDIFFLPCICLWPILQIQICLCGCRTLICIDIIRFYEEQCQPSSGSAWATCPKNGKSGTHYWGRRVSAQFAQQSARTAVTAPPIVRCFDWSQRC